MFENTKKLCDSFLEMGVPGFDLCVYKDGKSVLRYMGGYSDLEHKIPMNGKEKYYIFSCSKPITCVAAMQLFEKGLFSLKDKLSDFLPEFSQMTVKTENGIKKAKKPILIKHLFEMTAGFSYDCGSPKLRDAVRETNGKCPTRETMKYLSQEPLLFEPGSRWEYSLCHDVLAAVVEVLSGMPFNDYVTKNIFIPLNMTNSSFITPKEQKSEIACLYDFNRELKKPYNINLNNGYILGSEYASGGASCVSTVDDYMKFLEALRIGDIILKSETIELMTTDRLNAEQRKTCTVANYGYGLGMRCKIANGEYSDFGWGGAAGAHLAVDKENGISVYYAQHLVSSPNRDIRHNVYTLALAEIKGDDGKVKKIQKEISEFEKCSNLRY